jgi:hypothetical protein
VLLLLLLLLTVRRVLAAAAWLLAPLCILPFSVPCVGGASSCTKRLLPTHNLGQHSLQCCQRLWV